MRSVLRLGNDAKAGLHGFPAVGEFLLGSLIRNSGRYDDVLTRLTVHRRCDAVLSRQLAGVEQTQHLIEISAGAHRIGQRCLDPLVRSNHEVRADRRVVGGGSAVGAVAGICRQMSYSFATLSSGSPIIG